MQFIFDFVEILCEVLTLMILIRIVISWVSPGQTNGLTNILYLITEPLLLPLRRVLPQTGRFDFSPMAAVLILRVIILFLP